MSINSAPTKVNREKKGLLIDIQRLIREPSLLIIILLIMSLFILFIIYPFIKLVSLPNINDWKTFFIDKTYLLAFRNTLVSALLATTIVCLPA